MKTIGMIGGTSWQSSAEYYRLTNEYVQQHLGGFHNARSLMLTVNFADIHPLQLKDDWSELAGVMAEAGQQLEAAGAECLLLLSNSMHRIAAEVERALSIPLLHIADATGAAIDSAGLKCVGLLGTKYTMEGSFYTARLKRGRDLEVLTPDTESERDRLHAIILDELVHGVLTEQSRAIYLAAIDRLAARGAGGVILGCTEIPLLIKPHHTSLPLFDTTALHAAAAVDWAVG